MLTLLQYVESISSFRDRDRLPRALLSAVVELVGEDADVGIFSREPLGELTLRFSSGPNIKNMAASFWPEFLEDVRQDGELTTRSIRGRKFSALVLQSSELGNDQMILAYAVRQADMLDHDAYVASLARIYGNQIKLLDYSELDSLTRLLNRKTFDETFDRLLSAKPSDEQDDGSDDRRNDLSEDAPAWLCVVDIDHFKRVNDSFGHIFGDEVLLRTGDLMRKTFRDGDRLFRFGGEEFVVILNAPDESLAEKGFNRFRQSIEKHEFPQVGKVTCSIGFTSVNSMDVPTDVVGRADEALYFAKENGRNQVCCYERLVADGAIARPVSAKAPVADSFDIDALFA